MASTISRIGILTGGGDAPGLNAVIRAVVKTGTNCGMECIGLEDSFDGLIEPGRSRVLTPRDVTGILRLGGTILGTVNRGNPFANAIETSDGTRGYSERVIEMFHKMGLGALVVIGGDGTLAIAHQFSSRGIPLVGVPKTIDNDIVGTTNCFGFDTAVAFATDAIDRLHTTAEAHKRIMVVEVMGRYAGWIALYAGVAGGADAILIPEIPFDLDILAQRLLDRDRWGAKFSIVVARARAERRAGDRCRRGTRRPVERLGGTGIRCDAPRRRPARRRARSSWDTCSAAARRRASIASSPRGSAAKPSNSSEEVSSTRWWHSIRPTSWRDRWKTWSGRRRRYRRTSTCY